MTSEYAWGRGRNFIVDAEFIETDHFVDLISLAVIAVGGGEFYAISTEFDPGPANEFVRRNVLPQLEPPTHPAWRSRAEIRQGLVEFVGNTEPRFWSWGAAPYDWLVMAQLFPLEERMPDRWRYTAYDISLLAEQAGYATHPLDERLPAPPGSDAHHALADARWAYNVFSFLAAN